MPLPLLGALVVFGIAGLVALVWVLRLSPTRRIDSAAEALALLTADYPEATGEVLLSDDRQTALIATPNGLGVARIIGAGALTRLTPDLQVSDTKTGLRLRLDFTTPALPFVTSDTAAARSFIDRARRDP